jgi:hypothetical protein
VTLHEAPEEIGRALTDLAKAVFERRGEVATADMTRILPAPRRPEGYETAREGKK